MQWLYSSISFVKNAREDIGPVVPKVAKAASSTLQRRNVAAQEAGQVTVLQTRDALQVGKSIFAFWTAERAFAQKTIRTCVT